MDREPVIRASEVGQYTFCALAWWLGTVEGRASANQEEMAEGTAAHRRHGRQVQASVTMARLAWLFFALAGLAAAVVLLRLI